MLNVDLINFLLHSPPLRLRSESTKCERWELLFRAERGNKRPQLIPRRGEFHYIFLMFENVRHSSCSLLLCKAFFFAPSRPPNLFHLPNFYVFIAVRLEAVEFPFIGLSPRGFTLKDMPWPLAVIDKNFIKKKSSTRALATFNRATLDIIHLVAVPKH